MSVSDIVVVASFILGVAGILGLALIKFRSAASSAREESARETISLLTTHRNELQATVDRQNLRIVHQDKEIEALQTQVRVLRDVITAKEAIEALEIAEAQHTSAILEAILDLKTSLTGTT